MLAASNWHDGQIAHGALPVSKIRIRPLRQND
jgi:hypothetical protein